MDEVRISSFGFGRREVGDICKLSSEEWGRCPRASPDLCVARQFGACVDIVICARVTHKGTSGRSLITSAESFLPKAGLADMLNSPLLHSTGVPLLWSKSVVSAELEDPVTASSRGLLSLFHMAAMQMLLRWSLLLSHFSLHSLAGGGAIDSRLTILKYCM
jgi:hypothetical protein